METSSRDPFNPVQSHSAHSLTELDASQCSKCSGQLKDSIINFGDDLREDVLTAAIGEAMKCDLLLSLGSSMTVTPASDLIYINGKGTVACRYCQ